MNITYNGHASFTIEAGGYSVTVDPWLNTAFFGSWHPFPDNASRLQAILNSNAILLSHEHEDHCDLELLKTFKGSIYIPKYRSDSFCKKLSNSGIGFTQLESRQKHHLGAFNVEFVIQSAAAWEDAAIIISRAGNTFIDLNDLKPGVDDIEYIKEKYPDPTFMAYQYSGASWHPMTYIHLSAAEKREISRNKIYRKFKNSINLIEAFAPLFVLPSAGPPCFLYDELLKFNNGDTAIFPDLKDYQQFLQNEQIAAKPMYLQPGDNIKFDGGKIACNDELYSTERLPDRQAEINALKEKKNIRSFVNEPGFDELLPQTAITDYFNRVFDNSAPFKNLLRYLIHYEIINQEGNRYDIYVNFRKGTVSFNEHDPAISIGYKFTIHAGPFNKIINGENTWEELFLSLQFDMYQYLQQYDENAFTLHKFCHTDYLQKYFTHYRNSFKNETFILEHEGEKYEVQRFCPHAMGDLSKGEIVDGKIVCPNHGWAFCLKDGTSTTTDLCIQVKKEGKNIPA